MPLTESTVFDRVRIDCRCSAYSTSAARPFDGTARVPLTSSVLLDTTDTDKLEELRIMREAIADGSATLYYYDTELRTWTLWSDLPKKFWILHTQHDLLPNADTASLFEAMALDTGFERKGDGHPAFRFKGEVSTPPYAPTAGTTHFNMRAWRGIPATNPPRPFSDLHGHPPGAQDRYLRGHPQHARDSGPGPCDEQHQDVQSIYPRLRQRSSAQLPRRFYMDEPDI